MESDGMDQKDQHGKIYREWDTQDVSAWLKDQVKLPQYCETFQEIGVDGQIIDHITEVDLQEDFGIKVRLHRVKIIEGIKRLQVRENQRKTPPSSEIVAKSSAQHQQHLQQVQAAQAEQHAAAQNNIQAAQPSSRIMEPSPSQIAHVGGPQVAGQLQQNQFSTPAAAQAQQTSAHAVHLNQAPLARNQHHQMSGGEPYQQPAGATNNLIQQFGGGAPLGMQGQHHPGAGQIMGGQPGSNAPGLYHHQQPSDVNMQPQPMQNNQQPQPQMMAHDPARGSNMPQFDQQQVQNQRQNNVSAQPQMLQANGYALPPAAQADVQMRNDHAIEAPPQRSVTVSSGNQVAQYQNQQHRMQSQMVYRSSSNPDQNQPNVNQPVYGREQLHAGSDNIPQQQAQQQQVAQPQPQPQRVDTPPHSNSRNNALQGNSSDGGANGQQAHSIYSNAQPSEGMHVFINSQGGGVAVNGGKFVAASQQYLQELAKNQAASEYPSELQQSDILVLKAVEGQLLNNVYIIGDNGAALGRHSASNDMVISESFVSRRHCEIKYGESNSQSERGPPSSDGDLTNFYLRDIGSTTGTFIMVRQEVALQCNMMFQMGLSEFKVVTTSKPTMCELHVFEGPARNRMVPVDESGLTIGRDQNNSFCVQEDSQMSNYHAKIAYKQAVGPPGPNQQVRAGFYLTDVGSTNRTWLRLSAEGEQSALHPLRVGDILKIGSTVFVVESSDIHNLKYMPIINKRAQNGQQFSSGVLGAQANQEVDEQMQIVGGPQAVNDDVDGDLMLMEEEEELKESHEAHRREGQPIHRVAAQMDQAEPASAQSSQPGGSGAAAAQQQPEMCKLCYENECDAAFIPCGHVTACIKCAGRCNQCPVCRIPYHDIMKLYRQ